VKPKRDQYARKRVREVWWIFEEPRRLMRHALLGTSRYIATGQVAKHRVFQWLDSTILPDDKLIAIATEDALHLGVLSSVVHTPWALATGGTLEDRPVYSKSTCFEPFTFPSDDTGLTPTLTDRIRALAEQLDAHRKARQAEHAELTLTGMYNVLAKLRAGEPLSAKERATHEQGLVAVLRSLHDDLDAAVLAAYGWSDLAAPLADHTPAGAESRAAAVETLLERLVALNARRAAEEAAGTVRWLRPEFQTRPREAAAPVQAAIDLPVPTAAPARAEAGEADDADETAEAAEADAPDSATPPLAAPNAAAARRPWPAGLPEQIKAVADLLATAARPLTQPDIEAHFTARGRWRDRLPVILETLVALGRARAEGQGAWRGSGG
jgi:hypothetical protein